MTKHKQISLQRIAIILLIAVFSIGFISCKKKPTQPSDFQQSAGIFEDDGKGTETPDPENPEEPTQPEKPTFAEDTYYRIYVPYAGEGEGGYYNVSYQDTDTLKQLWLDQITRKGANDGKVFAIRSRANDRGVNNFQAPHNGRQDYFYFADNGDIYYKGGDKDNKTGETLMKTFVGAVIIDYRKVTRRSAQSDTKADDVIARTGKWTVGAVYRMAISHDDAQKKFAHWTEPTDGAYEFIAARRRIYTFYTPTVQESYWFKRQYDTSNLEVLVLNEDANEGNRGCLGVDAYYEYNESGPLVPRFTENSIGRERPAYLNKLLTYTTTFTDGSRWWSFLAMPANPESGNTGTTEGESGRLTRR